MPVSAYRAGIGDGEMSENLNGYLNGNLNGNLNVARQRGVWTVRLGANGPSCLDRSKVQRRRAK